MLEALASLCSEIWLCREDSTMRAAPAEVLEAEARQRFAGVRSFETLEELKNALKAATGTSLATGSLLFLGALLRSLGTDRPVDPFLVSDPGPSKFAP
jgi:folylpolyglutamate synthase/dihydropteroate synthase